MSSPLTRLNEKLWLDLDEVVSVQTSTDKVTYARIVTLTTRTGAKYAIRIGGTGGATRLVSEGDQILAEWLSEHLGDLLGTDGEGKS